jgi:transposase
MEWPVCSPDINAIEPLWSELGRHVRGQITRDTTLLDLRQILTDQWNAIPQRKVQRLVSSMRRRCQAVIGAFGGSTRY